MTDYAVAAGNILMYHEAEKILKRFGGARMPFLFLKGIFLAQEVYGDLSLRPMSDIDLLVRAADVRAASALLNAEGYAALEDPAKVLARSASYSLTFERLDQETGQRFFIDLHWHFLGATWLRILLSERIREEDVWEETTAFRLGAYEARALSAERHYIFIAQHCFSHAFDKPRMLEDLRRMQERFGLQARWPEVMKMARDWGLDEIVGYAAWVALRKKPSFFSYRLVYFFKLDRWPCLAYLALKRSWLGKFFYICKLLKTLILREF